MAPVLRADDILLEPEVLEDGEPLTGRAFLRLERLDRIFKDHRQAQLAIEAVAARRDDRGVANRRDRGVPGELTLVRVDLLRPVRLEARGMCAASADGAGRLGARGSVPEARDT